MRLARDHLTFRALCALQEAVDQTRKAPVQPSAGLRLALAYLYAVAEGDRAPFDSFWRAVQRPDGRSPWCGERFERAAEARRLLKLIGRLAGAPVDGPAMDRLERAVRRR